MSSEIKFVYNEEDPEVRSLTHTFPDEACKHLLLGAFEFDILKNSEVRFWELDKRLFLFLFVIFLVLLS